jgi:hypothetical protein
MTCSFPRAVHRERPTGEKQHKHSVLSIGCNSVDNTLFFGYTSVYVDLAMREPRR